MSVQSERTHVGLAAAVVVDVAVAARADDAAPGPVASIGLVSPQSDHAARIDLPGRPDPPSVRGQKCWIVDRAGSPSRLSPASVNWPSPDRWSVPRSGPHLRVPLFSARHDLFRYRCQA